MDYGYLDQKKYNDIKLYRIAENQNGLPFFIVKTDICAQEIHRHEYIQIIYIWKGRLKHVINNNVFDVFRGDIFVIPPYVPHYFIKDDAERFELIEFEFIPEYISDRFSTGLQSTGITDFAYVEPFLVVENEVKPRLNLQGKLQLEVESIISEVLREYETREEGFELLIRALLQKLLVLVGREFRRSLTGSESQALYDRHRDALQASIDFIGRSYASDIDLEEAARVAMLSQSYYRFLFKQMTQKTFTEYLNDLRISKAAELLRADMDKKIIDICYEVGYNNVNHFNRIFRQSTGSSPMAFRKLFRAKQ
jgi:AraC-like DNA-binding protein/mannose-6-phosphate isomerase-like protein (cupin superfamily)